MSDVRTHWTSDMINKLVDMYTTGQPVKRIAVALQLDPSKIYTKIHNMITAGELKKQRDFRRREEHDIFIPPESSKIYVIQKRNKDGGWTSTDFFGRYTVVYDKLWSLRLTTNHPEHYRIVIKEK